MTLVHDDRPQIVLVGGGHTHALVLRMLKSAPLGNVGATVINPTPTTSYSGMLPGFVAGHYSRDDIEIDLDRLARSAGAQLVTGRAIGMDQAKKRILLEDGSTLRFDFASIDVGITADMNDLDGFGFYGTPAKPLGAFAARWDQFRSSYCSKDVVVIGGGIAGAELSMAMAYALRDATDKHNVTLIDRTTLLSNSSRVARRRIRRSLVKHGVTIRENTCVQKVSDSFVELEDGATIPANFVVGAAGATPLPWLSELGLDLHNGLIVVDQTLQTSMAGVFAVGDCAHLAFDPRPKAGVFAVRQAPVLFENLRSVLTGDDLQSYAPQKDYLKLISLGAKRAFGEKYGVGVAGRLVWWVKDRIDREFMQQFR
ncbi:FAD-dependent oxidoreductase [Tateyamaria sp. SN3-11]|uniref:FAD-dependent oxidoreductase n=1 Tax=Tateyamaria sp. SN3-11 TaxID=3092147 RepID=UPI0039EBE2AC